MFKAKDEEIYDTAKRFSEEDSALLHHYGSYATIKKEGYASL